MLLLFLIREAEYHLLGCISITFVNCCVWFLGRDVGFIYIKSWLLATHQAWPTGSHMGRIWAQCPNRTNMGPILEF